MRIFKFKWLMTLAWPVLILLIVWIIQLTFGSFSYTLKGASHNFDTQANTHRIVLFAMLFRYENSFVGLFLDSVARNARFFDLLLITDLDRYASIAGKHSNVNVQVMSLNDLMGRIANQYCIKFQCTPRQKKLLTKAVIEFFSADTYRISQIKPMLPSALSEFIKDYDFWGWVDTDIIFGDFERMFPFDELKTIDAMAFNVAETASVFVSGQLALFRNTTRVKYAWTQLSYLKNYDAAMKYYAGDEMIIEESEFGIHLLRSMTDINWGIFDLQIDDTFIKHIIYDGKHVFGCDSPFLLTENGAYCDKVELIRSDGDHLFENRHMVKLIDHRIKSNGMLNLEHVPDTSVGGWYQKRYRYRQRTEPISYINRRINGKLKSQVTKELMGVEGRLKEGLFIHAHAAKRVRLAQRMDLKKGEILCIDMMKRHILVHSFSNQ